METRGDKYQGLIEVGQKIHCILYGGNDGIVYNIHGEQRPGTIERLGGGCVVMGGSAHFDVVFTGHSKHTSRMLPEGILRGVQWYVYDEIATQGEIEMALLEAEVERHNKEVQAKKEAEARAKHRQELPAKYPHLITTDKAGKLSRYALGAKNIKAELSKAFPGIKFSAKSDSFSGGCSIDVSWTDGPLQEEVRKLIGKYSDGSFNGMEDIYEYDLGNVWPDVFGGAKYVSESRHESKELTTRAAAELGYKLTDENFDQWGNLKGFDREVEMMLYREVRKTRGEIGKAKKAAFIPRPTTKNPILDLILSD